MHDVPILTGDTAPTPATPTHTDEEFVLNEKTDKVVLIPNRKRADEQTDVPELKGVCIQAAQTIPRVIARREGVIAEVRCEANTASDQKFGDWNINDAVRVH